MRSITGVVDAILATVMALLIAWGFSVWGGGFDHVLAGLAFDLLFFILFIAAWGVALLSKVSGGEERTIDQKKVIAVPASMALSMTVSTFAKEFSIWPGNVWLQLALILSVFAVIDHWLERGVEKWKEQATGIAPLVGSLAVFGFFSVSGGLLFLLVYGRLVEFEVVAGWEVLDTANDFVRTEGFNWLIRNA